MLKPTNNQGLIVTFEGALDPDCLEGALAQTVRRHSALLPRSHPIEWLPVGGGTPLAWSVERIDAMDHALRAREIARLAIVEPIDVQRGPLVRARLLVVAANLHYLLVSWPAWAADLRSGCVLLQECGRIYTALISNSPADLPAAPSVGGYQAAADLSDEDERFWRELLRDAPAPVELPVDRVIPARVSPAAGSIRHALDPAVIRGVRGLMAAQRVSVQAVLATAVAVQLQRLTGRVEFVLGAVSAAQDRPQWSSLVGDCEQVLPLRIRSRTSMQFAQLLSQIQQALDAAGGHIGHGLDRLLPDAVAGAQRTSFLPIVVASERRAPGESAFADLAATVQRMPAAAVDGEWRLTAVDDGTDMWLECDYSTDLFGEALVRARLEELAGILQVLVATPDADIASFDVVTPEQRQLILHGWNATGRNYALDVPLYEWIDRVMRKMPEAPALVSERGTWTYAELDRHVTALANELRRRGVRRDSIVGVCSKRSAEMVVALLATVKAGGAYLPLDPDYPVDRLGWMVEDAECPVIVQGPGLSPTVAGWLAGLATPVLALDASQPVDAPDVGAIDIAPDALAYVIFTSGSTGRPKGALLEHRGIVNRILWMQEEYQIGPGDRVLQKTPYSFDVSVWEFFWPFMTGASLVVARPDGHKDPMYLVDLITRQQVTVCHFVPSMLGVFLDFPGSAQCTTLRHVFASGEALAYSQTQRFHQRLPDARLHNLYGPTEASVDVSYWECPPDEPRRLVPIGRPTANTQLYVLDEKGEPLPIGVPGELFLGGVQLARGYLKRPDLTVERFIHDPKYGRLYRTGDLARWLPDGVVDFLGRIDSQVKLRGLRIELGEIETQLMALPAISEAVCAVRERTPGDQWLVAWVTARPGQQVDVAATRAELGKQLPDYMIPQLIAVVGQFERLTSGKIDRKVLPDPFAAVHAAPVASAHTPTARPAAVKPAARGLEQEIVARWSELLGSPVTDLDALFFELGGSSIQAIRFVGKLAADLDVSIPMAQFFDAPTVNKFCAYLRQQFPDAIERATGEVVSRDDAVRPGALSRQRREKSGDQRIAVVGMACRTPGAPDIDAFWNNILGGVDGLRRLSPDELRAGGFSEEQIARPDHVPVSGWVQDSDCFDHAFFGYTPKEAASTDPQQRMLLETAWAALEHAGVTPESIGGRRIGVFTGLAANSYLTRNLASHPEFREYGMDYATLGNEKDYSATRIAFKLNLHGPAIGIQTACSSSGTALHLAIQSLLAGDCDAALTGGAAAPWRYQYGHEYFEGGPLSRDGQVRSFDAAASGMVLTAGTACVVLKRLDDAVRDGDTIYAVICGTALNNDGSDKAAFTAPSVQAQAEVIREALDRAGVNAADIGYVEAHGTGTPLGDPIEVAALTRAYRFDTEATGYCALGSVKANIGHMDAAAAAAGLIKTTLMLKHRCMPKQAHFEEPNPECVLDTTPFFVNTATKPWESVGARYAGVSSFGFGGTNFHAVLQEPPPRESTPSPRAWHVLRLSAKTDQALQRQAANLAAWRAGHPEASLADAAWTLDRGRVRFSRRGVLVAREGIDATTLVPGEPVGASPSLVFMFPGQGAQHPGMGRHLFETEPVFRENMLRCAEILRGPLGLDLCELIHGGSPQAAEQLRATQLAQPAIFSVSYACAQLWRSWGFEPEAMIGHSVGEYVAATLAGVFSLEDALGLLAERARLMQHMPAGGMVAVRLGEADMAPWLGNDVELAAINGTQLCVVSGPHPALEALQVRLTAAGVSFSPLHTSHAFHSAMMEPAVEVFAAEVGRRVRNKPAQPFISSLTGTWITDEQAVDPHYWAAQLRHTVRFAPGISELLAEKGRVFLEAGPGQNLTTSTRQLLKPEHGAVAIASLPHAQHASADSSEHFAQALGRLWMAGLEVDPELFYAGERRNRIGLPTYPFARVRHWIRPAAYVEAVIDAQPEVVEDAPTGNEAAEELTPEAQVRELVSGIIRDQTGITIAPADYDRTFLDLGFDSLVLTTVTQKLKQALKCQLRFRQLLEEFTTVNALATHLNATIDPALLPKKAQTSAAVAVAPVAPVPVAVVHPPAVQTAGKGAAAPLAEEKMSGGQRASVRRLVERAGARVRASIETYRAQAPYLANGDAGPSALPWIELRAPVIVTHTSGASASDTDGNDYLDVRALPGAAALFGHEVPAADTGDLAAVAERLLALMQAERMVLHQGSGDACIDVVRAAQRRTNRRVVAMVAGASRSEPAWDAAIAAAGAVKLSLPFDHDATLESLRRASGQLCAIVFDTLQFGAAPWRIREFCERCQQVAVDAGIPLVFDESATGLRMASLTVQALLGIKPDVTVLGPALADGLPVGVIVGNAQWLQDCSGAAAIHPGVLARMAANLRFAAATQTERNDLSLRTADFFPRLNRQFRGLRAPLKVASLGSLYRIEVTQDEPFSALLPACLRLHGVLGDGELAVPGIAHSSAVLNELAERYRDAAAAMRRDGLLGRVGSPIAIGTDVSSSIAEWALPPDDGARLAYGPNGDLEWFTASRDVTSSLVQVRQ